MEEKLKIKQIADLAGVSVATVSRVINQNGRFSAETEQRVKDVIEKYHYVPNTVAKGLRTSRTPVIGIIVPDIVNNHFARLVLELEKTFFEQGYSTMICNTNESRELEERHVQTLVAQQVTGILFISGCRHYEIGNSIPVIYVDRRPDDFTEFPETIVIESDNREGGYLAAGALLERGCRRIGVLTSSGIDYNHRARMEGYRQAMQESGNGFLPELVIDVEEITIETAREAVKQAVDDGMEFDALVCTADVLAIGAILGLKERGRRVPEDVRVTGFDDTQMAGVYNPSVSSIHQCVDRMAVCAVDAMLALVEEGSVQERYQKLPVYMVERESTGSVPLADR